MLAYLTGGLGIVAVASVGYASLVQADRDAMQSEITDLQFQLSACGGRLQTILDDMRSDNEIDQIPDDSLVVVPDHWLRP